MKGVAVVVLDNGVFAWAVAYGVHGRVAVHGRAAAVHLIWPDGSSCLDPSVAALITGLRQVTRWSRAFRAMSYLSSGDRAYILRAGFVVL